MPHKPQDVYGVPNHPDVPQHKLWPKRKWMNYCHTPRPVRTSWVGLFDRAHPGYSDFVQSHSRGYFLGRPHEEMYPVWYEWWGVWATRGQLVLGTPRGEEADLSVEEAAERIRWNELSDGQGDLRAEIREGFSEAERPGVVDDSMIDDVSGAGVVAAGHVADWRHWVWLITGRNVCPHHHGWIRGLTPGVVRGFLAQTSLCKALGKPFRLLNLQDVWSDDPQIYATEMELMHELLESQFPEVPWFEREITPDNKGLNGGLNLNGL